MKLVKFVFLAAACIFLAATASATNVPSIPGDSYRGVYIAEYKILSNSEVEMVISNGKDYGRDTVGYTVELRKNGRTVGSARIDYEIDAHAAQVVTIRNWNGDHFDQVALRTGGARVSKKTRIASEVPFGMNWNTGTHVFRSYENSWGWVVETSGGTGHNADWKKPRRR